MALSARDRAQRALEKIDERIEKVTQRRDQAVRKVTARFDQQLKDLQAERDHAAQAPALQEADQPVDAEITE